MVNSNNNKSIMQKSLDDKWTLLPKIIRDHYDVVPGTINELKCMGTMDEVWYLSILKPFIIIGNLFLRALVPYRGNKIRTEVVNYTSVDSPFMHWHRTFYFPSKSPLVFESKLEHIKSNEIIEYVRFGIGIRLKMDVENNALVFKSSGFIWKIGSLFIRLPVELILGNSTVIESAISDDKYHVDFKMIHPLLGPTFLYNGEFSIT